ncbi:MAG: putative membrane protein, partial [Gammaproteobacteria bacterium]
MKALLQFLKSTMLGGLVFLIPVVGIIFVVGKALRLSMLVAEPLAAYLPVHSVIGVVLANLLAIGMVVVVCFLAGFAARNAMASRILSEAETRVLWKIPGYGFLKGLTDGISGDDSNASMRPVLAHFDDVAQVAFEMERLEDGRVVIYLPGAPDPWSGAVCLVAADRIEPLSITMVAAVQNLRMLGRGTRDLL